MAKNKLKWWNLPFLLMLIIGTVLIIRNNHTTPYQKNSGFIFGTTYNITYQYDTDLNAGIMSVLTQVDNSLSPFNDKSIISRINRNENVVVDSMFTSVFNLAEEVSGTTGGAFDITVAPLVNAWGFGFKNSAAVNQKMVDSLLNFVGYQKVSLVKGHVKKTDPRVMLDCSAIAKGFGSDMVAQYLLSKGIHNFMVEIGGEIVVRGNNPKDAPWKIGVDKPVDDSLATNTPIVATLKVTDIAMATSGNYRNFYYKDGKKYAHTIDPHTGYPVQHSILSATVLASTCAKADAYATSFMVLGLDKAKAVLAKHHELKAYFIYAGPRGENLTYASPSLKNFIN
jgi:thiamine biosynthesis lipoprotein